MDIERKVLKEAKGLETREKHLEHIVGKHLFTNRFAKFFKEGLRKNKQRFLKGVTTALIILMSAQSALAISKDTHNKVKDLYYQTKNNTISDKELTSKTQDILQRLDKEVKKDIKNKDFLQTRRLLGTYKKVAMYIGDKEMQDQIEEMIQHVHHSFVMHVDLQKPGVYSDKKNSIFIISETRAPAGYSYFERTERKSNIRNEAIRRIKAFCDKQGLAMGNSAALGHNVILRSDQENGKVRFLFEVRSIESKGQDLTEEMIHIAPKVPIQ